MKSARVAAMIALGIAAALTYNPGFASPASGPVIWYRSADGCPDGRAFLERLAKRGIDGRLADVGDRVDFVITIGADARGPSGRLERQSDAGTVTVRELAAERCDEVADALALSLALSFQSRTSEPSASTPGSSSSSSSSSSPRAAQRLSGDASEWSRDGRPRDELQRDRSADANAWRWAAGAQGSIVTGLAPDAAPAAAIFIERTSVGAKLLSPSFRISVLGVDGSSATNRGDLLVRLASLRLEGCPVRAHAGTFDLRPCVAADGGVFQAEGTGETGLASTDAWFDVGGSLRLAWAPVSLLALEAQGGGFVPITRYELRFENPAHSVYRTAPLGFEGAVGASLRWR